MAINKNHLFDELNGVKCAIVELNVSESRVAFLKTLLERNGFSVVVVPSPPPKIAVPAAVLTEGENQEKIVMNVDEKFTIGVTDVSFNVTNAIYGRLLKSNNGAVVTMAYWLQKESDSHDEIPYFDWRVS